MFELEGSLRLAEGHSLSLNAFDVGMQDPIIYSYDADTNAEAYRNLGRLGSRGWSWTTGCAAPGARAALGYSFYTPSGQNDVEDYLVPGHPNAFTGLPTHKATLTGTVKVLPWLSSSPTAVLVGQRYAVSAPDDEGVLLGADAAGASCCSTSSCAPRTWARAGLEVGAGVYNLLGADFRVAQPYTGGHAPLPVFSASSSCA